MQWRSREIVTGITRQHIPISALAHHIQELLVAALSTRDSKSTINWRWVLDYCFKTEKWMKIMRKKVKLIHYNYTMF